MGRLRIIAGSLRGRRLDVPDLSGLRPTPERVREALFSRLGDRVTGAKVLDVFAGTGALGLEALSRGAGQVTFVEQSEIAAKALRECLKEWKLDDRARVICSDVHRFSPAADASWDLILADPPYYGDDIVRFAQYLIAGKRFVSGGCLAVEREKAADPLSIEGLSLMNSSVYGDTKLEIYIPDYDGSGT